MHFISMFTDSPKIWASSLNVLRENFWCNLHDLHSQNYVIWLGWNNLKKIRKQIESYQSYLFKEIVNLGNCIFVAHSIWLEINSNRLPGERKEETLQDGN